MLLREFFYPGVVTATLVLAAALTVSLIWEVIGLFVYI